MNTFCSYYNQRTCTSCDVIEKTYEEQVELKEKVLKSALVGISHPPLEPTVTSVPSAFRNKAKLVVTGTVTDPVIGLWGEQTLDEGRELIDCPLHVPELNELFSAMREFIKLANLIPYNIAHKSGELKGLIAYHSEVSRQSYLRFVLRSKEPIDRIKKHHQQLLKKFSHLACISVNIQPLAHAILEGEEEIFITEAQSIVHELGETKFLLGPKAFVQTNQKVATRLYQTAASWVKDSGLKKFMELYCGQGAFSFFCAPYIQQGLGIEINPDAIEEANRTAQKYLLPHLKFQSADATKVAAAVREFAPEILLVNPPRRGLGPAVDIIKQQKPQMFIYSSCNHQTLCSDLVQLNDLYEIRKIQIFDMFPHTSHFETLVLLARKSS